ncbi:unnamed protein product [Phytophthora fragariaefolia]|uniref:Unnamed protein product n=1 Tax=Phytophthora fragariaefolia TaxID=1490495 RepID=A0A9W6YNT3_9STRA|nr:unnamed protein product [Phytophthora fragariaefolia]
MLWYPECTDNAAQQPKNLATALSAGDEQESPSRSELLPSGDESPEDATAGGILDSDGENDDGTYTWDDESPLQYEGPEMDEARSPRPEPWFDGALLAAVCRVGSIANGAIDANVLKTMRSDGLSAPVTHEPYNYLQ